MSLVLGESGVLAGLLSFIYRLAILIYPWSRVLFYVPLIRPRAFHSGKETVPSKAQEFRRPGISFILTGFSSGDSRRFVWRPASKLPDSYCEVWFEDSCLHEAGPAEGRPVEAQREWPLDPRRHQLRSKRARRLRAGRGASPKGKAWRRGSGRHRRPGRAQQVLREALAKGADRAIHLEGNEFVSLDAINTAKAIREAIKDESFDLIFTGLQSDDYGFAQTGVVLSELLGWPHATIIMQIEKKDGGIRVKRELESGYFQFVEMPLPALLTIQSGINKLRYATLIGIKQAKNKPLRKVTFAEIQSALGPNLQQIQRLYIPQKTKKTEMLEGTSAEIAKKLVEKLRNEVRVL